MRRWFALLLLALLPAQFSWAAVDVYCGHEADAHALHLGHHEHAPSDGADVTPNAAAADPEAPAVSDPDCGHCHASFASLLAPANAAVPPSSGAHPAAWTEGTVRTLAPSPPERPQWVALA